MNADPLSSLRAEVRQQTAPGFDPSHPARVRAYYALLFRRFRFETVLRKSPWISRRLWRCRPLVDRHIKQASEQGARQEVLNLGAA